MFRSSRSEFKSLLAEAGAFGIRFGRPVYFFCAFDITVPFWSLMTSAFGYPLAAFCPLARADWFLLLLGGPAPVLGTSRFL